MVSTRGDIARVIQTRMTEAIEQDSAVSGWFSVVNCDCRIARVSDLRGSDELPDFGRGVINVAIGHVCVV